MRLQNWFDIYLYFHGSGLSSINALETRIVSSNASYYCDSQYYCDSSTIVAIVVRGRNWLAWKAQVDVALRASSLHVWERLHAMRSDSVITRARLPHDNDIPITNLPAVV